MHLFACIVLLLGLTVCVFGQANICSRCSCHPPTKPVTIFCNCNEKFQRLTMSPGDMKDMGTLKKFSVSLCKSVDFQKNSFAEAHELAALSVQQVENVTISMGVFSALKMVTIEDVGNLRLEKKAFMGVDELRNLIIRRTNIPEIPEHALYDIKNLYSVDLEDVVIGTIRSNSVHLQMDDGYPMALDGCMINNIEEDGLVLVPARDFRLTRSKLTNVARNGITITSRGSVLVRENYIGANISDEAARVSGSPVMVINNTIERPPKHFLSNIQGPLTFSNNTLLHPNIDISQLGSLFNTNSTGNRLPCLCSQKTTMAYLSTSSQMAPLLEQNFCIAPCEVTLRSFPQKCPKSASEDGEDDDVTGAYFCEPEVTTTMMSTIATTRRSGRAAPRSSSTARPPMTAAPQHSGATMVTMCSALLSTVLVSLLLR